MKVRLNSFLFFIGFLISQNTHAALHPKIRKICGKVYITSSERILFNANEKKLICGDRGRDAWKIIPKNQAKFHLTNFLQARGYHFPKIAESNGRIDVDSGPITKISKIEILGDVEKVKISRRRVIGTSEVLTPKNLSDLESWTKERLQAVGHPCAKVKTSADTRDGFVQMLVNQDRPLVLNEIVVEPIEGVDERVLRRYDAFQFGKPYNGDFMSVTSDRLEDDGLVQSSHFTEKCFTNGRIEIDQTAVAGAPRLASVGIGANTEGLLLAKASWRHGRIGKNASVFETSVFGSFRKQQFDVSMDWHVFSPSSRFYIAPLVSFLREDEKQYENLSAFARVALTTRLDRQSDGFKISAGPQLRYTRPIRGATTELSHFTSLIAEVEWTSHYFEFYRLSPRQGFRVQFLSEFNSKKVFSDFNVQTFGVNGQVLFNYKHFDPPLVVLGLRGGLFTTLVDQSTANLAKLPPTYKHFLGGSQNLRGFARGELPGSSQGGLSGGYLSGEVRFGILPYKIQPFVLLDVGMLTNDRYLVQMPLYWSPGVGVRWESPIGAIRATVAHGFVQGGTVAQRSQLSHPQYYVSFGEEF